MGRLVLLSRAGAKPEPSHLVAAAPGRGLLQRGSLDQPIRLAGAGARSVRVSRTVSSNSRPLEFDSSWFAHSDNYSMIRHGLRAEKGVWWGCAAVKASSKLTISDMLGDLTAHRERDAGPASPQSARQFLGIQHPTTRNSQRPASAVRCHVPEPSATPPLSQRPASENGDGALPRGGTLRLYAPVRPVPPVRARVSEGDVMQISRGLIPKSGDSKCIIG